MWRLQSTLLVAVTSSVAGDVLEVVQSAEKSDEQLSRMPDVPLTSTVAEGRPTLFVDPSETRQKVEGFGGAITDSVAHVFSQLHSDVQQQVVDLMWGKFGQRYNLGRLTIGATDFSTVMYSYAEQHEDYDMATFNLDHDDKSGFISLVQQAQAANPEMEWISSPWSPPSWLKRNKDMRNSESPGVVQTDEAQIAYALYLSKYFTEMKNRNITVSRMTVQNEPHVKGQVAATYPCCGFTPEQERDFLRDYLGPRIRADHPDLKIFIHDDQKSDKDGKSTMMLDYTNAVMGDAQAAQYVDGVAFHWYGDNLKNYGELDKLHDLYPQLPLMATEATLEDPLLQHVTTSPWKEAQKYSYDIIGDLNSWTTGWIEWNVLLDSSGGPTCIGPSHTGLCTPEIGHCDAPILADTNKQKLEIRPSFWHMGHFSRYIPRGSTVVKSQVESKAGLNMLAVVTPDSELVVVVLNMNDNGNVDYQLQIGKSQYASLTIPPHSIQTLSATLPAQSLHV